MTATRRMTCSNCGHIWRVPAGMPEDPTDCPMCELRVCACGCGADLGDLRADAKFQDRSHAESLRRAGGGPSKLASVHAARTRTQDTIELERDEWITRIRYSILAAANVHPRKEVDADAIRELGVPDRFRSSITGPQFSALTREGLLEQIDFRPAKTGSRHGGVIRGYRLTDNGAEAFARMPEPPEVQEALKLVPDAVGAEAPKSLITDGDAEWAA